MPVGEGTSASCFADVPGQMEGLRLSLAYAVVFCRFDVFGFWVKKTCPSRVKCFCPCHPSSMAVCGLLSICVPSGT